MDGRQCGGEGKRLASEWTELDIRYDSATQELFGFGQAASRP